MIYPTLTMLEELGHATVEERDGKKLYAITAEGAASRHNSSAPPRT